MKKLLLKTILLLCALVVGSSNAWAEKVTLTATLSHLGVIREGQSGGA